MNGLAVVRAAQAAASKTATHIHSEDLQPNEAVNRKGNAKLPPVVASSRAGLQLRGRGRGRDGGYGAFAKSRGSTTLNTRGRGGFGGGHMRGNAAAGNRWQDRDARQKDQDFRSSYTGISNQTRMRVLLSASPVAQHSDSRPKESHQHQPYSIPLPPLKQKPPIPGLFSVLQKPGEASLKRLSPSAPGPTEARTRERSPSPKRRKTTHFSEPVARVESDSSAGSTSLPIPAPSASVVASSTDTLSWPLEKTEATSVKVKSEPRSPSPPIVLRKPVTGSCQFYPLPDDCRKSHADYAIRRRAYLEEKSNQLKEKGLKRTKYFFRDDGMVIEWSSPIPVWNDTLEPVGQEPTISSLSPASTMKPSNLTNNSGISHSASESASSRPSRPIPPSSSHHQLPKTPTMPSTPKALKPIALPEPKWMPVCSPPHRPPVEASSASRITSASRPEPLPTTDPISRFGHRLDLATAIEMSQLANANALTMTATNAPTSPTSRKGWTRPLAGRLDNECEEGNQEDKRWIEEGGRNVKAEDYGEEVKSGEKMTNEIRDQNLRGSIGEELHSTNAKVAEETGLNMHKDDGEDTKDEFLVGAPALSRALNGELVDGVLVSDFLVRYMQTFERNPAKLASAYAPNATFSYRILGRLCPSSFKTDTTMLPPPPIPIPAHDHARGRTEISDALRSLGRLHFVSRGDESGDKGMDVEYDVVKLRDDGILLNVYGQTVVEGGVAGRDGRGHKGVRRAGANTNVISGLGLRQRLVVDQMFILSKKAGGMDGWPLMVVVHHMTMRRP
ncbi:hypothetical protein AX17_007549 [Amanita inopinata Kibby_2008]|nr:hypothetical protein AX17_007549 [Amanita inopinata Kibby_2008]